MTYNPAEKGCCEGSPNALFDLATQRCCGGNPTVYQTIYNISFSGKIQSKTDMDIACCGEGSKGTEYRPGGTFGCCNGESRLY